MRKRPPLAPLQAENLYLAKKSNKVALESVFKNALEIQEKVPTLEAFAAEPQFEIENCYISANPLQSERFSSPTTYIQKSQAIKALMSEDCGKSLEKSEVSYITGPMGGGKSYALLFYVLMQRKTGSCAVLYINNPASLLQGKWLTYVVNEVVYAISTDLKLDLDAIAQQVFDLKEDDTNYLASIRGIFSDIVDMSDYQGILRIIQKLNTFYRKKEKDFILIFDQHTKYEEMQDQNRVTKDLTEKLLDEFSKKVYGRSTLEPLGTAAKQNEIFLGSSFTCEEATAYLAQKLNLYSVIYKRLIEELGLQEEGDFDLSEDDYLDDDKTQLKPKESVVSRIEEATEFIPYELEVIARLTNKFPNSTLANLLETYYLERIPALQKIHRKWVSRISNLESTRLNQFIFVLDNSLATDKESLTNLIGEPDPNLIYFDEETKRWSYINRLTKEAVYRFYRETLQFIEFLQQNLYGYMKQIVCLLLSNRTPGRTKNVFLKDLSNTHSELQTIKQKNFNFNVTRTKPKKLKRFQYP